MTLKPDARNARKHGERNKRMIRASLEEVGAFRSIAVDGDGIVRAGNGVYEQAQALGIKVREVEAAPDELIAVVRRDLRGQAAERAAMWDNRSGETSEWDADVLAELMATEPDVLAGLWDRDELAALLQDAAGPEAAGEDPGPQVDKAAELQAKWQVQPGDVWTMGEHRLICGDCTDAATVARLMRGERAACVFTSPPYNSDSELHGTDNFRGSLYLDKSVDSMTPAEYRDFNSRVFAVIGCSTEDSANVYYNIFYNKNNRGGYILAIADAIQAGFNLYETIAWRKHGMPNPASRDVLTRDFEFIFLLNRGSTYRTNKQSGDARSNVWEISNIGAQTGQHKACFPVGLPSRAIEDATEAGAIVYEPFSGSGTTIIACENLHRRCRAVEIAPAYCSVALERWAQLTARAPAREPAP